MGSVGTRWSAGHSVSDVNAVTSAADLIAEVADQYAAAFANGVG